MKSRNLSEWAALAEVIASVAVIVSLIFERHTDLSMQFMLDPSLAEILVKMRSSKSQLTEIEAVRWGKYQLNLLDVWALAFNRYKADLLAEAEWVAWDGFFADVF